MTPLPAPTSSTRSPGDTSASATRRAAQLLSSWCHPHRPPDREGVERPDTEHHHRRHAEESGTPPSSGASAISDRCVTLDACASGWCWCSRWSWWRSSPPAPWSPSGAAARHRDGVITESLAGLAVGDAKEITVELPDDRHTEARVFLARSGAREVHAYLREEHAPRLPARCSPHDATITITSRRAVLRGSVRRLRVLVRRQSAPGVRVRATSTATTVEVRDDARRDRPAAAHPRLGAAALERVRRLSPSASAGSKPASVRRSEKH